MRSLRNAGGHGHAGCLPAENAADAANSFYKEQLMLIQRITKWTLWTVGLVVVAAPTLSAQERLFEWRGRVDHEVRLTMRGGQLWTQEVAGQDTRGARVRVSHALPAQAGEVQIRLLNGRGDVSVIQQPSRRNNYTTIVRIYDPSAGADRYRLVAQWVPVGGLVGGDIDFDDRYASGVLRWSGAVDDQVEIWIRGRSVNTRTISGNGTRDVRANLGGRALPRRDVTVSVRERQGRGTVWVAQQPSQWNGYTAVIRIRDRQGGFGYYDLDVTW